MFSIANFLDSVKAAASIDSDYRLAKVIGRNHSVITNYRTGVSLPNEAVICQLCALSGDDPDLIAAQVAALRAKDDAGRDLWTRIAARLENDRRKVGRGLTTAILSVFAAMVLLVLPVDSARAATANAVKSQAVYFLYIVSSAFLSVAWHIPGRLRWLSQWCGSRWCCNIT